MSDQPAPDQQVQTPGQQAPTQSTTPTEDWKKRFDGAVLKIQQLTEENRNLTTQLESKSSEIEQLKAQLGVKDAEKAAAVGERDKQLQTAIQTKTEMETELAELRAMRLKLDVIKELNSPSLLKIMGNIPNMTDKEALKVVMKDFADFAASAASEREKQIMAGVTPGVGPAPVASTPVSADAWEAKINSLPLGSSERAKMLDQYGDWLEAQHSQR